MGDQDRLDEATVIDSDLVMKNLGLRIKDMKEAIALFNSRAVGGLPEAWSSELHRFMTTIYRKIQEIAPSYEALFISAVDSTDGSQNADEHLLELQQTWGDIRSEAEVHKERLENKLNESILFQEKLQSFDDWLSNTENMVANFRPLSRRTRNLDLQTGEHARLQEDVKKYREKLERLKNQGAQLSNGQRQDTSLINNLLINVEHRLKGVILKVEERGRLLQAARRAKNKFSPSPVRKTHAAL